MKRQGDPGRSGHDAVFRSSRRVSFVVRSEKPTRQPSGARVSRDPIESMQVDVRPDPAPPPPAFGLESDWSELSESLEAVVAGEDTLRLWNRDAGDAVAASAAKRHDIFYIAASDANADPASELIEIERDLFENVKSRRKAIAISFEQDDRNQVVEFDTVSDLFGGAEERGAASRQSTNAAPATEAAARQPSKRAVTAERIQIPSAAANSEAPPRQTTAPAGTSLEGGASRLRALTSPRGFPDSLQSALVTALRPLSENFGAALLFQVEYADGQTEYLVGFATASASHEADLETAVNKALAAANRPDIELGITFLEGGDPMVVRISRVGLQLL